MTNVTTGRWLLVALAMVGLAFAAPVVSAHGNETAVDGTHAHTHAHETADGWVVWMEAYMTDNVGPDAVDSMEAHRGVPVDDRAQDRADDDYHRGYGQRHC